MSEEITQEVKATVVQTPSIEFQEREIKARSAYKALAEKFENLEAKSNAEKKELLERTVSFQQQNESLSKKFMEAELKAQATAEGIKDIDFVKLMDTSELKIMENGSVDGIAKVIADFKARKPELFGTDKRTSSSTGAQMPEEKPKVFANAMKMTDAEFKASLASKGIRF